MNPSILNEALYKFDWASMSLPSDDLTPEDVIADIARTARKHWGLPLQENGLMITRVETDAMRGSGWPYAEIRGKAESVIRFVYAYWDCKNDVNYGSIPMENINIGDVIDCYGESRQESMIPGIAPVKPDHDGYRVISLNGGDVYVVGLDSEQ